MYGCDLRGADRQKAYLSLHGASFNGASLVGTDLRGSRLDGIQVGGAKLHGPIIEPMQAALLAAVPGWWGAGIAGIGFVP